MNKQTCPSNLELSSFDLGELPDKRFEEISEHLDTCASCAGRFERLAQVPDPMFEHLRIPLPLEIIQEDSEVVRLIGRTESLLDTSFPKITENVQSIKRPNKLEVDELVKALLRPAESDELGRLGHYRVLEVLGIGGMGVVFKAEDTHLKRFVALKVMLPHHSSSGNSSVERFLREAQVAAAINHDNVVTIHQVSCDGEIPYLAMQLLQGESLSNRLAKESSVPILDVCRIARETAEGLAAAHNKGLMHRDIKPENIWLESSRDRVKIVDFGLARADGDEANLTETGTVVGTPSYLSPEQTRGMQGDERSDLFSLGVVIYQVLTGVRPFHRSSTLAILRAIDSDTPPPPSDLRDDIPPALSALVMKLLEKDPQQRFQTARDVVLAIKSIERSITQPSDASPLPFPSVSALDAKKTPLSRRLMIAAAGAFFFLILGVVITVKDKDGIVIARILGEHGMTIDVEENNVKAGDATTQTDRESVKDSGGKELGNFLRPMCKLALVQKPAQLVSTDGMVVDSWTIAPRAVPGGGKNIPALRPDGTVMAVFSDDGAVRIWNLETSELIQILVGHDDGPATTDGGQHRYRRTNSRRFGPNAWQAGSNLLATASRDGSVRVWDVISGRTVFQFQGEVGSVNMLAWSPDGTKLAAAFASDGSIRCWQVVDWDEIPSIEPLYLTPRSLVWSPDNTHLIISTDQETILWNTDTGTNRELPELPRTGNVSIGYSTIRWSPDGKLLAYVNPKSLVTILNVETLSAVHELTHEDAAIPIDFAWSPDGQQLLVLWRTPGDAKHALIHSLKSGERSIAAKNVNGSSVEWLTDRHHLAFGSHLKGLDSELVHEFGHGVYLESSDDGQTFINLELHGDPVAHRYHPESKSYEPIFQPHHFNSSLSIAPQDKVLSMVYPAAVVEWKDTVSLEHFRLTNRIESWAPDGKHVLTYNNQWQLRSWPSGEIIHELTGVPTAHAWSADGSRFAVAYSSDQSLQVIDVVSGQASDLWHDSANIDQNINSIAWAPDGRLIAVAAKGIVGIIDVVNGALERRIELPEGSGRLNWTPTERLLSFRDDRGDVLDPVAGRVVRKIDVSVSPQSVGGRPGPLPIHFVDDHTIRFVSADGHLSELDTVSGGTRKLGPMKCRPIQFSGDGKYLIGEQGGTHRVFRVPEGNLVVTQFMASSTDCYFIGPKGHVWNTVEPGGQRKRWARSPGLAKEIVYIVKTKNGQQTLTPLEFALKYDWQNEPDKVSLK